MSYLKKAKWVRAIIFTTLILLLSSCGSGEKGASSGDVSIESSDKQLITSYDGDDESASVDPIERLSGKYYIDGDQTAPRVEITSDGSFTAFYATGTVEQTGYVRYEADNSDYGNYFVYVFYTDEGKPYMGFVDSGENKISEFETGNGSYKYVRVE